MKRTFIRLAVVATGMVIAVAGYLGTARADGQDDDAGLQEEVRNERVGTSGRTLQMVFAPGVEEQRAIADAFAAEQGFSAGAELHSSYATPETWPLGTAPVRVYYNGRREPEGLSGEAALRRAIATWNTVPEQSFAFEFAGASRASSTVKGAGCDATPDGVNVVHFAPLPEGLLGYTCTWYTYGPGGKKLISHFDMVLSTDQPWSTDRETPTEKYDLESLMLHELGHALGLGHSDLRSAAMYQGIAAGEVRRELTADDIAGLRALYGTRQGSTSTRPTPNAASAAASPTVTPPEPTGTPTTTPSSTRGNTAPQPLTVVPNGRYTEGANSVVVLGSGNASAAAALAREASGKNVGSIWMLVGGRWIFFLPALPQVDGGLTEFAGPVATGVVVLN